MNKIFVDTSGWASLVDPREEFHRIAAAIYIKAKQSRTRLVTTNYIISELTALLISPLRIHQPKSIEFINGMKSSRIIDIIHIDSDMDERAWNLLQKRADKPWSLVDCSSFVLMTELRIIEALTTDHNFEQAGFIRLLK